MGGYITLRIPTTASEEEANEVLEILEKARELTHRIGILDTKKWEIEYETKTDTEFEEDEYMVAYEEDPVMSEEEEQAYLLSVDEYLMKLAKGHRPDISRGMIDRDPAYDAGIPLLNHR